MSQREDMSHYEKLAVTIIRSAACIAILFGLTVFPYLAFYALFYELFSAENVHSLFAGIAYIIVGIAAYALSKLIAEVIGKGL